MLSTDDSAHQTPCIYKLKEIEEAISSPQFGSNLLGAIEAGFIQYSEGGFNACPIQTLGAPPMAAFTDAKNYAAQTCVKSGYLTGASHYVIKVASGGHPLPNSGLMQLFSQSTGRLEALLLDEGILTELRTAAAGAVAAKILAPPCVVRIGMLGTGVQARYQLRYLKLVTDCRNVLVWGRTQEKVEQFERDMAAEGWKVEAAEEPDDLLESCELIVTTTCARGPILGLVSGRSDTKAQHITCIGADATRKMELAPELVAAADFLVADSRLQTKERGEFEEAISRGLISVDKVLELGEVLKRTALQRSKDGSDKRLTIFDTSGVAVQDCVIAKMIYDTLLKQNAST
mmetsp:Transcript_31395/g.93942  ORF Transcript_31395/g.93942 Transcript_31395/m.93942 type:complete len:345 (-) Transcript_31395:43-1077(-)